MNIAFPLIERSSPLTQQVQTFIENLLRERWGSIKSCLILHTSEYQKSQPSWALLLLVVFLLLSRQVIHYNFIPHKILIGKVKKAHFSFSAFCDMISLQYGRSNYKKKARNAVWQGQSVFLSEFLLKVVSSIIFHSLRHLPLSYVFILTLRKCFDIFFIPCFSVVGKFCNKKM